MNGTSLIMIVFMFISLPLTAANLILFRGHLKRAYGIILIAVYTYSLTTTIVSCLSNTMLIYVLAVTHLAHVGPYRYLLLIFAVVDVLISLVHLALIPAIHMTEFGYIYFGYRFIHDDTSTGVGAGLIWVLLFYQTFVLLAFHYMYRYVMLCSPAWLSGFRQNPWCSWLAATFVGDVIFVGGILLCCFMGLLPNEQSRAAFAPVIKEIYSIDLFAPNKPGYLGIIYWTLNDRGEKEWIPWEVFTICCVIVLFFTTALIIIFCILRIVLELSDKRVGNLAPATKRLQKQLFNTLLWQTIIPTITSYTPLAMIFLVPLTGISLDGFGTVLIMSTALFPMLDPYIVIFLISGYAFSKKTTKNCTTNEKPWCNA
ncbi:hypothetical protein PRIPAC_76994 [Pristionchus pacificus]|nr:hypothetical protein PRIPAC_76994 [Pristionchus pacificus]